MITGDDHTSGHSASRLGVVGLVKKYYPPTLARPGTRDDVPRGYGVQEQCLPYTAAAALGLLILSPISWGYCKRSDIPACARAFDSPIEGGDSSRRFYVIDDVDFAFTGNRFSIPSETCQFIGDAPLPGISFFERSDQQDHVKLHLPYVWNNDAIQSMLFCAPLNRLRTDGLTVVSGLVETAIYANPVNLVLRLPPGEDPVHVAAGDIIAQAILIDNVSRQPDLQLLEPHRKQSRDTLKAMAEWRNVHNSNRSAYKTLVKSRHGRILEN